MSLDLGTPGPDPSFSPTTASSGSVQVGRSRWESTNELKNTCCGPHYQHFASGRAKNRNSVVSESHSTEDSLHRLKAPLFYHFVCFAEGDARTHTVSFKRGALL